jgi:hypothetical protein
MNIYKQRIDFLRTLIDLDSDVGQSDSVRSGCNACATSVDHRVSKLSILVMKGKLALALPELVLREDCLTNTTAYRN